MSKLLVTEAEAEILFSALPESKNRDLIPDEDVESYESLEDRGLLNKYRDTDWDWWVTTDKGRRALVFYVRGVSVRP